MIFTNRNTDDIMKPNRYNGFDLVLIYNPQVIRDTNIEYHKRVSAIVFSGGLPKFVQRIVIKAIKIRFANIGSITGSLLTKPSFRENNINNDPINHNEVKVANVIFK